MKKYILLALKGLKYLSLIIFVPFLSYLLIGLILTLIPTRPTALECDSNQKVYFSSSIIHVDIILPIELLDSFFQKKLDIPNETKYVGFGWGDKAFYLETRTWADLSILTAFKSLAIKTPSAMHVTYHKDLHKDWKSRDVCNVQAQSIHTHILSGFELNDDQSFKFIENGYAKNDFFYEGNGAYTGLKTCNTWVNQSMKKAKLKTAIWTPFNFGVLRYIQ